MQPVIQSHIIPHRVQYDCIEALNYSGSKELLKSPAHYHLYVTAEREQTKALRLGSYVHALVLEPAKARTAAWPLLCPTPKPIDANNIKQRDRIFIHLP